MENEKTGVLAREAQWSKRAGVAALVGSILALVGFVLLQSAIGGEANFEGLREADEQSSTIWASGILAGIGYALLAIPLYLLFKAAEARSASVRGQFAGLAILGPLLLGLSASVIAAGTQQAADNYLSNEAAPALTSKAALEDCREERIDRGAQKFGEEFGEQGVSPAAACAATKTEEANASEAIEDAGLVTFGRFTGLAGGLALLVALFYTGLWAMRTGLLSRFWGSLGMAVGVAALIGITPLALFWFFYLGLLLVGTVPGGRPPAWAAGEAIPWPTPAEKAAAELEGPAGEGEEPARELGVGEAERGESGSGEGEDPAPGEPGTPRRKRKKRD